MRRCVLGGVGRVAKMTGSRDEDLKYGARCVGVLADVMLSHREFVCPGDSSREKKKMTANVAVHNQ